MPGTQPSLTALVQEARRLLPRLGAQDAAIKVVYGGASPTWDKFGPYIPALKRVLGAATVRRELYQALRMDKTLRTEHRHQFAMIWSGRYASTNEVVRSELAIIVAAMVEMYVTEQLLRK